MAQSPPSIDIMDFVQRFQALQIQRDSSDGLIKDLLIYCEQTERSLRHENARLAKDLEDANLDLDDARRSRRDLQQKLNYAETRMGQANADFDTLMNRNPYIIVLIDGDGMIFNESLVRLGIEGGKQAANILRNSVLENCSDLTDHIEVMAKVCANMDGLSKALRRDGLIENADDFRDFTQGFTQGKASFDFIDVGHGKERADSKIKEIMRWHLKNHNCKQILLGISHDAGYAPFVDEVVTPDDRRRITIIEGCPTVRELAATGLQILKFSKLFRAEKLVDRVPNAPPATWAGVTSIVTAPPPPVASPTLSKNGGVPIKKATPPVPTWNPGPRGLDSPLVTNPVVLEKVKRRSKDNKLCNNHYLRGPCINDNCQFEHDYKPTQDEINAISYLARLNPCTNMQDCVHEICIYGHHCPSITWGPNGPECKAYSCKFQPWDHPEGTTVTRLTKDRWEKEAAY